MIYEFGPFEFDPASGDLRRDGVETRLPRQPSRLLEALVKQGGEVVTRQEIRALLWADSKVEFDQGINFCVRQIREALSDSHAEPEFLETLPRRGYRILVPVSVRERSAAAPGVRWGRDVVVAGLLGIAVVAATGLLASRSSSPGGLPLPMMAVLPHRAVSANAGLVRFRDRLAEELVSELTRSGLKHVRVAGPAATTPLLDSSTPSHAARTTLDACLTVSGSLDMLPGAGFSVFTQLIRTGDDAHLWTSRDTISADQADALAARWTVELLEVLAETDCFEP